MLAWRASEKAVLEAIVNGMRRRMGRCGRRWLAAFQGLAGIDRLLDRTRNPGDPARA